MNMTIRCESAIELAVVCAQLTREGIAFRAFTSNMTIEITGY